jgi:hypothetical protein
MNYRIPLNDPGNACPVPRYSGADGAQAKACNAGLSKMNLDALAGPNSDLCKKLKLAKLQYDLSPNEPCRGPTTPKYGPVTQPVAFVGGGTVDIIVPCPKEASVLVHWGDGTYTAVPAIYFKPTWSFEQILGNGRKGGPDPFIMPTVITGLPKLPTAPANGTTVIHGDEGRFIPNLFGPGGVLTKPLPPASSDSSGGAINKPGNGLISNRHVNVTIPPRKPGGSGGASTVVNQPDRPPRAKPPYVRNPGVGWAAKPGGRGVGGGFNTSTDSNRGNNAMEILGDRNTGGALAGVAGNSGGLDVPRPRPGFNPAVAPGGGGGKPEQVAKRPGVTNTGGSGGFNTSHEGGNAPKGTGGSGGFNTSREGGNAASNGLSRPVPRLKIDPVAPSTGPVDYGGCPGCGKPADLHVR